METYQCVSALHEGELEITKRVAVAYKYAIIIILLWFTIILGVHVCYVLVVCVYGMLAKWKLSKLLFCLDLANILVWWCSVVKRLYVCRWLFGALRKWPLLVFSYGNYLCIAKVVGVQFFLFFMVLVVGLFVEALWF